MDAEISHDPFAPDEATAPAFRSDLWSVAGANDSEMTDLLESYDRMSLREQVAEARALERAEPADLEAALDRMREVGDFAGYQGAPEAEDDAKTDEAFASSDHWLAVAIREAAVRRLGPPEADGFASSDHPLATALRSATTREID